MIGRTIISIALKPIKPYLSIRPQFTESVINIGVNQLDYFWKCGTKTFKGDVEHFKWKKDLEAETIILGHEYYYFYYQKIVKKKKKK